MKGHILILHSRENVFFPLFTPLPIFKSKYVTKASLYAELLHQDKDTARQETHGVRNQLKEISKI